MFILIIFVVAAEISVIRGNLIYDNSHLHCHTSGVHYYEQVGCTANYAECGGCPLSYKCPDGQTKPGTCKIAGNIYQTDERIVGTSPCLFCHCSAEENKVGNMACAMPRCYVPTFNDTNCRVTDDLYKCCPQDKVCITDCSAKCLVDGIVYEESQIFEPKNTCLQCICNKDFRGIYEAPFCRPKSCDLYFRFDQEFTNNPNFFYECSPIYSDWDMCCPSDFICDVPVNATIDTSNGTKIQGCNSQCKIGSHTFSKGDKFSYQQETEKVTVTCECIVPSLMRCAILAE